jgi:hypothetical protein
MLRKLPAYLKDYDIHIDSDDYAFVEPSEAVESETEESIEIDDMPNIAPYPYRSKIPFMKTTPKHIGPIFKDTQLKTLKKYYRPYFSRYFDSYELDYFNSGEIMDEEIPDKTYFRMYLMFININTKFIVVYPVRLNKRPSSHFSKTCIDDMIHNKHIVIKNIRGDDDFTFSGKFLDYLKKNGISYYFSGSKFTNKNRVVDRAIRTIKDGIGLNREFLLMPEYVQQIVDYYNNTPHSAYENNFTPRDVMNDKELELWYIRKQMRELVAVVKRQRQVFQGYEKGNVLLIHIPLNKTNIVFQKRRLNFDELAIFYDYNHGNVRIELLNANLIKRLGAKLITIPIYYTRFLAHSLDELHPTYKKYFNQK